MNFLSDYQKFFCTKYENFPLSRYINLIILRKTESEAIFRTEGSGDGLNKEFTHAGIMKVDVIPRVIISKRKQVAVERRTGRELLRNFNLLFNAGKKGDEICAMNRNTPCAKCIDCMVYGYAVGGGGAQKARVITDDSFSILPFNLVTDEKTFNSLYDNGTMRDPVTGEASSSIGSDEYVKPETHFLDIQTLKDVTQEEFIYVLGNILRSNRYGAISSRIGKVKNEILAVIFSNTEIFSNLELTQAVYDKINTESLLLNDEEVRTHVKTVIPELLKDVTGIKQEMLFLHMEELIKEVRKIYADEKEIKEMLEKATKLYPEPKK